MVFGLQIKPILSIIQLIAILQYITIFSRPYQSSYTPLFYKQIAYAE